MFVAGQSAKAPPAFSIQFQGIPFRIQVGGFDVCKQQSVPNLPEEASD